MRFFAWVFLILTVVAVVFDWQAIAEAGEFVLFEPRLKYGEHSFNAFEEDSFYIEKILYRVATEDREFLIDFFFNDKAIKPFQESNFKLLLSLFQLS